MRVLSFTVTGQKLAADPVCDFSGLVSNSRGYLQARFRFSADWAGCKKAAIFTGIGKGVPVPLVNNTCVIPAEALTGRSVQVCVVGLRADGYRIPTNTIEFKQITGR